jgi:hypothetical protein
MCVQSQEWGARCRMGLLTVARWTAVGVRAGKKGTAQQPAFHQYDPWNIHATCCLAPSTTGTRSVGGRRCKMVGTINGASYQCSDLTDQHTGLVLTSGLGGAIARACVRWHFIWLPSGLSAQCSTCSTLMIGRLHYRPEQSLNSPSSSSIL